MWLMQCTRRSYFSRKAPPAGYRLLQSASDEVPVDEFLAKHLAPGGTPLTGITSTRREVLSLYREVWRATRLFTWPNEQGVSWKDVLRLSARREFEAAQYEKDPETIARLLVVGRDAVRAALEKFTEKRDELITKKDLPGQTS